MHPLANIPSCAKAFLVLATLFLFSIPAKAEKVQEFELQNGLKILVKEDHRTAVVVSQIWYKVGGSYEPPGITGISHALEHMMFRGTTLYPGTQFTQLIASHGGRENAQTSHDYTFYYEELSANELPLALELEADRMSHLTLKKSDFDKEKQIILEERRLRVDDDPFSLTYEKFAEKAFLNAYRNPVIGWVQDIEALNANKLKKWYQTWYAPNNATLVVVGDVNAQEVYQLAQKFFAHLPTSVIPTTTPQLITSKPTEQEIIIKIPAKLPWVLLGYRAPSLLTATSKEDAYALEVAAGILSSGQSARLNKKLVREKQLASEANASYDLYERLDGLFLISAIPQKGITPTQLKTALLDEVKQLQNSQVNSEELTRIKNQVMARQIYKKDSMFGEARQLGLLETVGLSWKLADQYMENIQAVTAEQVQDVAKRYLQPDKLTIAVLAPQSRSHVLGKQMKLQKL